MMIGFYMITIVFNHGNFYGVLPRSLKYYQQSQISQLLGCFLWVIYVIDSSLVDPVFDITPEEKVQRCNIWRPGGPSSRTSTSNPGITKSGVKISSDVPGPVWRGSVLLEHQVWDLTKLTFSHKRICQKCVHSRGIL